jgi:hypothetical protein
MSEISTLTDCSESASGRQVTVEREGSGATLIFIARTRNAAELAELDELFQDLKAGCHLRVLSRGPVTAAAVKVIDDPEGEASAELMSLLETLGDQYSFSRIHIGLHPTLNRLIEDMAMDTGSDLFPVAPCSLCTRPEPFPTRLSLQEPDHEKQVGQYCSACIARFENTEEREWIAALLETDRETFGIEEALELNPMPTRKGNRVSYRAVSLRPQAASG